MTKEQIRSEMKKRLPEYFEQFLLIGVVAGTGEVVITATENDPVRNPAIKYSVQQLIKQHGIGK